jgi:hypothetical protein
LIIIIVIVFGVWYGMKDKDTVKQDMVNQPVSTATTTDMTPAITEDTAATIIGRSAEGNAIMAYHYGMGTEEVIFVGGIHGGYEWNTVLVAQELADYLADNADAIPANLRMTVIPALNPDGLKKVTGTTTGHFTKADVSTAQDVVVSGRFNGNNVDLNRNFACDWQESAMWQNKKVSGGKSEFSESESQAIRDYVTKNNPKAVIVWYSSAGGVYASNCHNGVSTETREIMNVFAKASGYPAHDDFNFYEVTGDMTNWLAKVNVPSISILLTNHTDTEWTKNLAGVKAVLKHYAK